MRRAFASFALLGVIVVASFAVYAFYLRGPCNPTLATQSTYPGLSKRTFGSVTQYELPNSTRYANAITVAGDGSVWFGEQGAPGVGHLVPGSGSLTEYRWPCYPTPKNGGVVASVWGITVWNGKVWAADGDNNRLVGLDPSSGATTYVNTTSAIFPYLLAPSPDGSLWFTALSSPAKLGRLGSDLHLSIYQVPGLGHEYPIQVAFVNSSFGYMVALDPYHANDSGLYSFNPSVTAGGIAVQRVGGSFKLFYPQGLFVSGSTIWVSQHFPSNIVAFDTRSGVWTVYPTSTISYQTTTLPYFVEVSGGNVWFNEHYANRIALLDPAAGTLTEYSESDPAATGASGIQNDLTIATASNGAWFTSTSGNYIGFVDGTSAPDFTMTGVGSNEATLGPSSSATWELRVDGTWSAPLSVQVSDSENYTSIPSLISIQADRSTIPAGSGPATLTVTVSPKAGILPGRYTVAVTVTGGLLLQTAYLFVTVT
jgi:streptogramin lyase